MRNSIIAITMLLATVTFGQTYKLDTIVSVTDGKDNPIDIRYVIHTDKSGLSLEEIHQNYKDNYTESDVEEVRKKTTYEIVSGDARYLNLMVSMFKVKHPITWVPKQVIAYYSEEDKTFNVTMRGYAKNSYGVEGGITAYFVMDTNKKIQRHPRLW